jgi:hypothetical protein
VTVEEEKEDRLAMRQHFAHEADDLAMERFKETHPEHVHAELEFFTVGDAEKKKLKVEKKQDEDGPSTVKEEEEEEKYIDDPFYQGVDWEGLLQEGDN